jgi:putative SOS response-associated peptidase YedK
MCGRIVQSDEVEKIANPLGAVPPYPNAPPRYNLAPTEKAVVGYVDPETNLRRIGLFEFGLIPPFMKDAKKQASMINAKSETIADKPSYRAAFRKRRAVVPVTAFYEWQEVIPKFKQPYAIRRRDGQPLLIAAIWEQWREPGTKDQARRSFSIVTTSANALMEQLHDRMPVILSEDVLPVWFDEEEGDYAALMRPCVPDLLEMYKVSRDVNYVRNDHPGLLDRLAA